MLTRRQHRNSIGTTLEHPCFVGLFLSVPKRIDPVKSTEITRLPSTALLHRSPQTVELDRNIGTDRNNREKQGCSYVPTPPQTSEQHRNNRCRKVTFCAANTPQAEFTGPGTAWLARILAAGIGVWCVETGPSGDVEWLTVVGEVSDTQRAWLAHHAAALGRAWLEVTRGT